MRRSPITRVWPATAIVIVGWMSIAPVSAQPPSARTVLTIHSGSEFFPSNPIVDSAIRDVLLKANQPPIDYYAEYLESDRIGHDASAALADYVGRKYRSHHIDLVIAVTNDALTFVLAHRRELFPDAPVVFAGIAIPDETIRLAGHGVAVVRVGSAYVETLKLALQLHPEADHVYVVARSSNRQDVESARAQLDVFSQQVKLTFIDEETLTRALEIIRKVPPRSIVLHIWQRGSEEDRPDPLGTARRVAEAAPVPVYGTIDLNVGTGIVGGVVRGTRQTGTRVAEIALQILGGVPAQRIPVEDAPLVPIFDGRQLRRWGISEARVPVGAQIRFREPGVWDRYKVYIAGAAALLFAQSGLIGAMLLQSGRRRRAETQIRDLGGRLLGAQEAERSRIARELHDDVSQQAALLAIDIQLVADSSRDQHHTNALARQAAERTVSIARSLHDLSHRLHPAKLRMMGLIPAVQSLCREFPKTVTVTFSHHDVPDRLSEDLTLCLFRIAQEALQNAVKHGAAHNVSVELAGRRSMVSIIIVDDGIGFDVDAVSTKGLGLISMRERVEPLGGTSKIHSRPGAGTRVQISVPVAFLV